MATQETLPVLGATGWDGTMASAFAVLNTAMDARMWIIGDGTATVPVRPATTSPVWFDCTTAPPLTGTTAGGTAAAVNGLDRWFG